MRQAEGEYSSLLHPGINAQGKTVKSPVDGITFVKGAQPPHMICAHHTICAKADLEKKWLLDPTNVKQRKITSKTPEPGDVLKYIAIVEDQRSQIPDTRCTLVLTTNEEPDQGLIRKVNNICSASRIEVDIWSRSRLAAFLDQSPEGQYIRQEKLGIRQHRLSQSLLRDLSHKSCSHYAQQMLPDALVPRKALQSLEHPLQPLLLVEGKSGYGKSALCYMRLKSHVEAGGYGVIVPENILELSHSLEDALTITLRKLHPELSKDAGSTARSLIPEGQSLLIAIEDVNRARSPVDLISKLLGWIRPGASPNQQSVVPRRSSMQVLCPVWPEVIARLDDEKRKLVQKYVVELNVYEQEEAILAVQRSCAKNGFDLPRDQAQTITEELGRDPLLIALYDPHEAPAPDQVIKSYIQNCLQRLARGAGRYSVDEYMDSLLALCLPMLSNHNLTPEWRHIKRWLATHEAHIASLRDLYKEGHVIRLAEGRDGDVLSFRHDRVRDNLIVQALASEFENGTNLGAALHEPYYAGYIGQALAAANAPDRILKDCAAHTPLTLFHAFQKVGAEVSDRQKRILAQIMDWASSEHPQHPSNDHLLWEAKRILSQTVSQSVIPIVKSLLKGKPMRRYTSEATFRNGALEGGIAYFHFAELGLGVYGQRELLEYVRRTHRTNLSKGLTSVLNTRAIAQSVRRAALVLAGHLQDEELADAIQASWAIDPTHVDHLDAYLWAGAQCGGQNVADVLRPVLDLWATLPENRKLVSGVIGRDDIASHGVNWAFQRSIPEQALDFFFGQCNRVELAWCISFMLHGIDHPDVLEHCVRYLAALEAKGVASTSVSSWPSDWRMRDIRGEPPMSYESKGRLKSLWQDGSQERGVRKIAFSYWASARSDDDLHLLQQIPAGHFLFESALGHRLGREDATATSLLLKHLRHDEGSWWWHYAKFVAGRDLFQEIEDRLEDRPVSGDEANSDIVWHITELLLLAPTPFVESLFDQHWNWACKIPRFVQVALFHASPRLLDFAKNAIQNSAEPQSLLKQLGVLYGFYRSDAPGITRKAQVEALLPYLDYLDDHEVQSIWGSCNTLELFELRVAHLDQRLMTQEKGLYHAILSEEAAFELLDEETQHRGLIRAERWLEEFMLCGNTLDDAMEILGHWLNLRQSEAALNVVAGMVERFGNRKHIGLLENIDLETISGWRDRLDNCKFSTYLRTLR